MIKIETLSIVQFERMCKGWQYPMHTYSPKAFVSSDIRRWKVSVSWADYDRMKCGSHTPPIGNEKQFGQSHRQLITVY